MDTRLVAHVGLGNSTCLVWAETRCIYRNHEPPQLPSDNAVPARRPVHDDKKQLYLPTIIIRHFDKL